MARRTTVNGTTYRSEFESRVAATVPANYTYENVKLTYTIDHFYKPDFVDVENKHIIEAKGIFDGADRRKHKALKAQHPDWKVTIIFQNPNVKISKASNTTYAQWCDKHGIEWKRG